VSLIVSESVCVCHCIRGTRSRHKCDGGYVCTHTVDCVKQHNMRKTQYAENPFLFAINFFSLLYLHVFTSTYTRTKTHTITDVHTHIHPHTHTHTHTHTGIPTSTQTRTHLYAHTHTQHTRNMHAHIYEKKRDR